MQTEVHFGPTGGSGIKEESNGRRGHLSRDICGVFSTDIEFSGVTGRRMSGKVEQPREAQASPNVSTLEAKGGYPTGGTGTTT